jgi:hypothetical protein
MIEDWCPVIFHRKGKKHPYLEFRNKACDRSLELEDLESRTPGQEKELERLNRILDDNRDYEREHYSRVYLHRVLCPRNVYDAAAKHYQATHDEKNSDDSNTSQWAFWYWGEQVFFTDSFLPSLTISRITEMNFAEYKVEYKQMQRSREYRNFHLYRLMAEETKKREAKKT